MIAVHPASSFNPIIVVVVFLNDDPDLKDASLHHSFTDPSNIRIRLGTNKLSGVYKIITLFFFFGAKYVAWVLSDRTNRVRQFMVAFYDMKFLRGKPEPTKNITNPV
jgi:hypothetical protein